MPERKPDSQKKVSHGRRAGDVPAPARERVDTEAEQARRTVAAREQERRRLAADLHDGVGTNLAAVKMDLSWIARALPPGASSEMQLLIDAQQLLDDTILNIRELCSGLHPTLLDQTGLSEALATHCTRLSLRTGLAIELDLDIGDLRFEPEIELMLLRVAQEALWNCVKHANATLVRITCTPKGSRHRFVVHDNGRGYDPGQVGASGDGSGIGIPGMRERALSVDARFTLWSTPGKGTTITVDF